VSAFFFRLTYETPEHNTM